MFRFVCIAFLVSLALAKLKFKDCGKHEVKSVTVSGCKTDPCTLHKNKNVTIAVQFTANQDSENIKIQILAKVGLFRIKVTGFDNDACKHITCPIKNGETYNLKYTVTIPKSAPTIEADVTAKLIGDHGILGCGTIHGAIKN